MVAILVKTEWEQEKLVDVDAIMVMDAIPVPFSAEIIPACGSSFFSSSAADAATAVMTTAMDAEVLMDSAEITPVCGSSFSSSSVADAATDLTKYFTNF